MAIYLKLRLFGRYEIFPNVHWVFFPSRGVKVTNVNLSRQLDHYNVGVSYFTRGYDKERPSKHRYIGLTVGANLDEILATNSAAHWAKTRAVVRYFKLPYTFTGLYYDLDNNKAGFRYGLNYFY